MVEFTIDQYDLLLLIGGIIIILGCIYFGNIFIKNIIKALKSKSEVKVKEKEIKLTPTETNSIKKKLKTEYEQKVKDDYKHLEENTGYRKLKDFNILKDKRKKNLKYFKDWYNNKYNPSRIILINMELNNGFHKTFLVKEKENGFIFNKKQFVLDSDQKYYNIDARMWGYDFHENYVLPVKRKIPVKDIRDTMKSVDMAEIEYSTNPSTLEKFISSEIAKQVLKSAQLDEWLRKMFTMILFTLISAVGTLIYLLYSTGAFENLQGGLGL